MRCKHDTSAKAATAAVSEVANAEPSCYGVFRRLEPDDAAGGGGQERAVTAGRPPSTAFSVQRPAFAFDTAAADCDHGDDYLDHGYGDFYRGTYPAYDSDRNAAAATDVHREETASTATTVTTSGAASASRRCYDDDGPTDFVVWDDADRQPHQPQHHQQQQQQQQQQQHRELLMSL